MTSLSQHQQIIDLVCSGHDLEQVGAALQVNRPTILAALQDLTAGPATQKQRIFDLAYGGHSVDDVAGWLNLQRAVVSAALQDPSGSPSGTTGTSGGSGGGTTAATSVVAAPAVASQTYSIGQAVTGGSPTQVYTAPGALTAAGSFTAGQWTLGAPAGGLVFEQNGSGQVVGVWSGNGLGTAASKIMDVLTAGAFTPGGAYNAGTAYSPGAIVLESGSSYINVASATGIDPVTDWNGGAGGTHWMQLAAQGPTGATGPTGPAGSASPATTSAIGAVQIVGTIANASVPLVQSGDDYQKAALASDLGAITASTTLANVTGLGLAITASATEVWFVKYWMLISGANTAMDIKYGFTAPTGATMQWGNNTNFFAGTVVGSSPNQMLLVNGTLSQGTAANVKFATQLSGWVFGGGTAGTVQLQVAQNTSDAGALTVSKGSWFEATRIVA